jgi:hypothetical protein
MDADLQLLINPDNARLTDMALAHARAANEPAQVHYEPDPSFQGSEASEPPASESGESEQAESVASESVKSVVRQTRRQSGGKQSFQNKTDIVAEKTSLLFKLDRLEKSGEHVTKRYTLSDDIVELRTEVARLERDRNLRKSIKFQQSMLMSFTSGLEFLNNRFDPIGANLEGWSESVHDGIDQYDDVFVELYDKYQTGGSLPPEVKLVMMLASSAFMFHLTNSMFKSSTPDVANVMKQNPGLARQFAAASAKTMAQDLPAQGNPMGGGLAGMFSGMFAAPQREVPAAEIEEIFSEISNEDSVVADMKQARGTMSGTSLVLDL